MKPVIVPAHAFVFCRYSIAVLVWVSWSLHSVWCLGIAAAILGLSAVLKVGRAPLILFYSSTIARFIKSPDTILEENAMRFAHTLGTAFALACLGTIWMSPRVGWRITLLFAILKTISALGFCPASKLFTCATGSSCCPTAKRVLGICQPKDTKTGGR
jgi:hypothetical protein